MENPEFLAQPLTYTLEWRSSGYSELSTFICDPDQAKRFMFESPRP